MDIGREQINDIQKDYQKSPLNPLHLMYINKMELQNRVCKLS